MNKLLSLVLLFGTIALSPSPCGSSEELFDRKTYNRYLQQGLRLLQAGKHAAAIIAFEKAVTVNPEAEAYYYLGQAYSLKAKRNRDRRSTQKAEQNFALVRELDPEFKPLRMLAPTAADTGAGVGEGEQVDLQQTVTREMQTDTAASRDAPFRANLQRTGSFTANRISAKPSVKWMFISEGRDLSSPIAYRDMILIVDEVNIYAVNRTTGTLRWKYPVSGTGPPAVADRLVYVGGGSNSLFALNVFAGTVQWKIQSGTQPVSSPATAAGMILFGGASGSGGIGYLAAVDAATGEERWIFKTTNRVTTPPAQYDGTVYVGHGGGQVYAINAADGTKKWETPLLLSVTGSPAVTADAVYFGIGSGSTGALLAVSRATGQALWKIRTSGSVHSPAFADGVVFFGTSENQAGTFYAADGKSGRVLWQYHSGAWIEAPPAIAGGIVYVATHDGILHGFDAKTGQELWYFPSERRYPGAPLPLESTVYFSSGNTLFALE